MYAKTGALTATGTVATLPYTGSNMVWLVIAAFALFAAGLAVLRMVPRNEA